LVGDGAGEDVGGAAAGVGDADQRDFDLLEGAVVVETERGELAGAELVVDMHAGVDFFAAVSVGFEADAGFEELDLCGSLGGRRGLFPRLGVLSVRGMRKAQEHQNTEPEIQYGCHKRSVGG
jgi:hypothetical protein